MIGPMLPKHVLEGWVLACVQAHETDYLRELERQTGRRLGTLDTFRGVSRGGPVAKFASGQLPGIHVHAEGLAEQPVRRAGGWEAAWAVVVQVIHGAGDDPHAVCDDYAAMVRTLLLQHQDLGGHDTTIEWIDEDYSDVAPSAPSTFAGAVLGLIVRVHTPAVSNGRSSAPAGNPYAPQQPEPLGTDIEPEVHHANEQEAGPDA